MSDRKCLLYFFASLCVVFVSLPSNGLPVNRGKAVQELEKSDSGDRDLSWDYFLFVQQNPAAYCHFNGGSDCYYPSNTTTLTIHGIWPSKTGTQGPNSCDPSATFDSATLDALLPRLVKEWTNSRHDEGFYSFWSHEWLKHGTCASGISSMSTEYDFFAEVLSLFENNYNYASVLRENGINPSNTTTYSIDQFNNAFVGSYGVKPFLQCLYSKEEEKQYLLQIELCLQKDFSVTECPSSVMTSYGACWDTEPIYFKPSPFYKN